MAALVYVFSKADDAKTDRHTSAKLTEIVAKLNDFVAKNGQLPSSLDDAGVNDVPSSISYAKTSLSQYQLCGYYKFSGSTSHAAFLGQLSNWRSSSAAEPAGNSDFINGSSLVSSYNAGQNCQTLKDPGVKNLNSARGASSNSAGLLSAKCGDSGSAFELKLETTVNSVDSGQGILTLETASAKLTDKNENPVKSLPTVKYDSLTKVYSVTDCKKLDMKNIDSLKNGAAVVVYLYTQDGAYADQVEL